MDSKLIILIMLFRPNTVNLLTFRKLNTNPPPIMFPRKYSVRLCHNECRPVTEKLHVNISELDEFIGK